MANKGKTNQNFITIGIGSRDPDEYIARLHEALKEIFPLVFFGEKVELNENQERALQVLAEFQIRLSGLNNID